MQPFIFQPVNNSKQIKDNLKLLIMKKSLYLFALLFIAVNVNYAQSSEEKIEEDVIIIDENWPEAPKTLIKERTTHWGLYCNCRILWSIREK